MVLAKLMHACFNRTLLLATVLLLGACAAPAPREAQPLTPLRQATTELPAADVLNVNITVFEADVPAGEAAEIQQIYRDIRDAEARYIPFHLRQVLEASGHWGDVRVVPESIPSSELEISGRILESHGDELKLQILARDASDRIWLDRQYRTTADISSYDSRRSASAAAADKDPFQDIYHRIANDLVAARDELPGAEKLAVQRLAQVRFAADLAPAAYAQHLQRRRGRWQLDGMPAADDPLLQRIELAAQRDAAMVDTLDQYYRDFHTRMAEPYRNWRAASYQEIRNLRELQYQARSRKALGIMAIIGGIVGVAALPMAIWARRCQPSPLPVVSIPCPAASTRVVRPTSTSPRCRSWRARWAMTCNRARWSCVIAPCASPVRQNFSIANGASCWPR